MEDLEKQLELAKQEVNKWDHLLRTARNGHAGGHAEMALAHAEAKYNQILEQVHHAQEKESRGFKH
ncbi:hypothetical protein [Saccharospirillum salsuginis]|nr:hypothetical protein [Saccharospirillum salsuginis]